MEKSLSGLGTAGIGSVGAPGATKAAVQDALKALQADLAAQETKGHGRQLRGPEGGEGLVGRPTK